jgi:hypothetical protein
MTSEGVGARSGVKSAEFSLVEAHLSLKFEQTHDPRTYSVDTTGGGPTSVVYDVADLFKFEMVSR